MDTKEKLLGSIEQRLTVYANWINQGGGIRSDASEDLYCGLLNTAFGYELRNMNWVKDNFPAIDLGDAEERLAVQITSTGDSDKVRRTLTRFYDHKLERDYSRLIVLVAGKAACKGTKLDHPGLELEVWGTVELLNELRRLPVKKLREVDAFLQERVDAPRVKEPVLCLPVPEWRNPVGFLGRKAELAWIGEELKHGTKPVVVAGLGGVGKTALVVEFQKKHWPGHKYFARFRDSFRRTLADSVGQAIPVEKRKGLDEEQTAELVLQYLRRCEPDALLIVDNAEVPGKSWAELTSDPFYEKIRSLPMAVLMTTRHRDTGGKWLGRLAQEELRQIFRGHEVDISVPEMDELIDAVDGHTMTVDMIARTIRESWGDVTPAQILAEMKNSTLNRGDYDEIETDHDPEQRKIYAHLRALFDLSAITEDGSQALRCAVLLPQSGMDAKLFRTALPEGAAREIKKLEKRGWVDLKAGLVTIHPVVRLVCRTELELSEAYCGDFLRSIKAQYSRKQYNADQFRQRAELFEHAADILEDQNGVWTGEAGYFWSKVAEHRRALSCRLRTVEKREQKQPGSSELAKAYNNVGSTYGTLGDHKLALEYKLKAMKLREQVLEADDPALAASYNNVGTSYGELGSHKKALEYKLKAMKLRERVLRENHPDLAVSYNNVGISYGAMGEHKKSLEYKLKALRIREQELGENHPEVAASYNNVGYTYGQMGDHAARLEYSARALEIRERVLPKNHPDIAMSCNNIAWAYYRLGQLDRAATYMRRAAEIVNRSTLPEQHRKRVNYNKWADKLEAEAQQAQPGG